METRSPGAAAKDSVWIGAYSLEVGRLGSFARFDPKEERENARDVERALDQEPDERPAVIAAVEDFQESADEVTSRIEQADKLLDDAMSGKLLDIRNVSGEIDALLDLAGRLDSEGRFDEELRLMRSLNGLLALSLRWLDLIRSLWRLLRSAEGAGHKAAQAFAHHELGSLNLCAGRAKDAVDHLGQASDLEQQIGDLAGSCATRHNLDSARRDLALRSKPWFRRPGVAQRLVILAGALAIAAGSGAGLALAIQGDGGGGGGAGGTTAKATLIVHEDFAPDAPAASAVIEVSCTNGGQPDEASKTATEGSPAMFSIAGLQDGATCTATQGGTTAGYTVAQRNCREVAVQPGETSSCTITNRRVRTTSFVVREDFVPNAVGSAVEVSVVCADGGRPDRSSRRVTEAAPATFTISGFGKTAICTAKATPGPAGYVQNGDQCRRVAIARGRSASCTIVGTRSTVVSAVLTVAKDFSDDNSAAVSISVTCTSGSVSKTPLDVAEGSPAAFTITGFGKGATCTATESSAPSGYAANESNCRGVAIATGGSFSCTIVDTLNTATLTVQKVFSDGNTTGVNVVLVCTSGAIDDPSQGASSTRPAVFTITGFETGATCTATENKFPAGYDRDQSDCLDVPVESRSECTLKNSPIG
jgi:hypothetical protein